MGNSNCVADGKGHDYYIVKLTNNLGFDLSLDTEFECGCPYEHKGFVARHGKFITAPPVMVRQGETVCFDFSRRVNAFEYPSVRVRYRDDSGRLCADLDMATHTPTNGATPGIYGIDEGVEIWLSGEEKSTTRYTLLCHSREICVHLGNNPQMSSG